MAGLAAPGDEFPPKRPKGDDPPVLDAAGLAPPTAGFVPVERVPPKDDELLLLDGAGFLSSAFAPPPNRPVIPPNKPPGFAPLLALGVAGLSPALAVPPPKRPVMPPSKPPELPELLALGVAGLSLSPPPPPKRPAMPPNTPGFLSSGLLGLLPAGLAGLLLGLEGEELLPAGRLPPNGDDPPDPPELPELPLLDPLPNVDPLPAGRLGVDELPPPELPPGDDGLLGEAGRLPPNGDDPPEPPELPPLDPLPNVDPLPAGRLLPNPAPELPELAPGEVGLLAGRLPPNGDVPPLDVVGLLGDAGRLPGVDEPSGGRAADEAELLGTGLVRPPAPGRFEVGRLLELPKGFTRD